MELIAILIFIAIFAGIGWAIDGPRGAALGGLLSIPGLIIAAILHSKEEQ